MGAGAAAAIAAAIANAVKASGILVRVEPGDFQSLLLKVKDPLVVYAEGGVFSTNYQYLVSYKGFVFFTKSSSPLILPSAVETILVKKIWIPG